MQDANKNPQSAQIAAEMQRLQGTWVQTECEVDGIRNPPGDYGIAPRLIIIDNVFVVARADGVVVIKGIFSVDPTHHPKEIDWTDTFGVDSGKTFPAIYELDGDRLVFCAADDSAARPTEFRTRKGLVLRIHQRVIPQGETDSAYAHQT